MKTGEIDDDSVSGVYTTDDRTAVPSSAYFEAQVREEELRVMREFAIRRIDDDDYSAISGTQTLDSTMYRRTDHEKMLGDFSLDGASLDQSYIPPPPPKQPPAPAASPKRARGWTLLGMKRPDGTPLRTRTPQAATKSTNTPKTASASSPATLEPEESDIKVSLQDVFPDYVAEPVNLGPRPPSSIIVAVKGVNEAPIKKDEQPNDAAGDKKRAGPVLTTKRLICALAILLAMVVAVVVSAIIFTQRDGNTTVDRTSSAITNQGEVDPFQPAVEKTDLPSTEPSSEPTARPTNQPTLGPTGHPTASPTSSPTAWPDSCGSDSSTATFLVAPSNVEGNCTWLAANSSLQSELCIPGNEAYTVCRETCRNCSPTPAPTGAPTKAPTRAPTRAPTQAPVVAATPSPTRAPVQTSAPTSSPVVEVFTTPPTRPPTRAPTRAPTAAPVPEPTRSPTLRPTPRPTDPPIPEDIRSQILSGAPRSTQRALQDSTSPQSQAMEWVEESSNSMSTDQLQRRFALACFAFSVGQSSSLINDNDECDWPGISCNASGRVEEINYSDESLFGSLVPELAMLSDLVSLDMSYNAIEGPIPTEFGLMSKLRVLRLDRNDISGQIPRDVGDMLELRVVHLEWNDLTGSFPNDIFSRLTNLIELQLHTNKLTGEVTDQFCDLGVDTFTIDCREVDVDPTCYSQCWFQCGGNTGIPCNGRRVRGLTDYAMTEGNK